MTSFIDFCKKCLNNIRKDNTDYCKIKKLHILWLPEVLGEMRIKCKNFEVGLKK